MKEDEEYQVYSVQKHNVKSCLYNVSREFFSSKFSSLNELGGENTIPQVLSAMTKCLHHTSSSPDWLVILKGMDRNNPKLILEDRVKPAFLNT